MKLLIATFFLAFTLAASAQANPNCNDRAYWEERLAVKYSEQVVAGGIQVSNGYDFAFEVWASEGGSFTILITDAAGRSCVVAAGTDYFSVELPEGDPA